MQRVAIWASVACAALNSFQLFTAASSHTTEPVVIFTQTASTGAPRWIIIPVLFDFLPVVLQLDVHRDVAFQLRRFCAFHGLDVTKCSVLHEALSELVNMDKWCADGAIQQLPSFMIVKNFLVSATSMRDSSDQHQRHGGASYRWIQDEAGNLAIDLCRFVESRGIDVGGTECVESLGGAIQRSFEWLNSLPSCDVQEATETVERASAIKSAVHSTEQLATRISAVEQLIADIVADQHRNLTLQKTQDDTSSPKENRGQQSDTLNEWKEVSAPPSQIQSAGEGHEASEHHETESTAAPTHVNTTDPQDEVTASLTTIEDDNTDGSSTVSFAVKEEESEVTESVDGQAEDAENASETATVLVGTNLMHDTDMKAKSNEESPKNDRETEAPATLATIETEESQQAARSLTAEGGEMEAEFDRVVTMEKHAAMDKDKITTTHDESASGEPTGEAASRSVHESGHSMMDTVGTEQKPIVYEEADATNQDTSIGDALDQEKEDSHHTRVSDKEPEMTKLDEADACEPVDVDDQTSVIDADLHARDFKLEPSPFNMSTSAIFLDQLSDANELDADNVHDRTFDPVADSPSRSPTPTRHYSKNSSAPPQALHQYEALRIWSPASMSRMAGSTEGEVWIGFTSEALIVIVSLFFVSYLLCSFGSLAINYVTSENWPQKRGSQISPTEVHAEPECNPKGASVAHDRKATKRQPPSAVPTDVIAPVPSLRSWQNIFYDSNFRSVTPFTYAFVRKVHVFERVTAAYRRQLQRVAFGFWRQRSIPVLQDAASTRSTLQDAENQCAGEEAELKRPSSFTCAAMALLFAMHGTYLHKMSPESSKTGQEHSQLQRTTSGLLSNEDCEMGETTGESKPRKRAAQTIQRAWRMRHKRSVSPSAADKTASSKLSNASLLRKRSFPAQPKRSSSLFQLLAKKNRQDDSSRPANLKRATSFGGRLGGRASASHLSLPPAS